MADILQFCRPEEVGVMPEWVTDYVREMNSRHKMCHSFLMMRHGKVFAEGYWKPFDKDGLHRMYSVSKTFVSAAVGMLVDEGKIKLSDRIADFFPDQLEDGIHPLIAEMTIEDMLKMATCHKYNSYNGHELASYVLPSALRTRPPCGNGIPLRYLRNVHARRSR